MFAMSDTDYLTPPQAADAAEALALARVLKTDTELAEIIQTKAKLRTRMERILLPLVALGFLINAIAFAISPQALGILSAVGFSIPIWLLGDSWRTKHRQTKAAQEALAKQDYDYKALWSVVGRGSLALVGNDHYAWRDISESVTAYPALARRWAEWLLSEKPIRRGDTMLMSDAIEARKNQAEWEARVEQASQLEGRQKALETLPGTLMSSIKAEQLEGQWAPQAAASVKPRF